MQTSRWNKLDGEDGDEGGKDFAEVLKVLGETPASSDEEPEDK